MFAFSFHFILQDVYFSISCQHIFEYTRDIPSIHIAIMQKALLVSVIPRLVSGVKHIEKKFCLVVTNSRTNIKVVKEYT